MWASIGLRFPLSLPMADIDDSPPPFVPVDDAVPPSYHGHGGVQTAATARQTEVVTSLDTSKGKPWVALKVLSRANHVRIPLIMQGEPIAGTVELDLEKTEHVEAVTLKVHSESSNFLPFG